jgi:uncharacterized protein
VERNSDVPYHGWHHVTFVSAKAIEFARELGADGNVVEVAALVHDLNYLVDPKTSASGGATIRRSILVNAGISDHQVGIIEQVVIEAEMSSRGADIVPEAKALSDADTLFKALPLTPVLLAPLYMKETGRSIRELAAKIVDEQTPLYKKGIYFYSASARQRYTAWGGANLELWRQILDCLDDPDVLRLLEMVSLD